MSRTTRVYRLSDVLKANQLSLRFEANSMVVVQHADGKRLWEMTFSNREVAPLELVRFFSDSLKGKVIDDRGDAARDDVSWDLHKRYEAALYQKPTISADRPGSAFQFYPERLDASTGEYTFVFPRIDKGSYAFEVEIDGCRRFREWEDEVKKLGIELRFTEDWSVAYAAKFPGGSLGFVPAPLKLSNFRLGNLEVGQMDVSKQETWCAVPQDWPCVLLSGPFADSSKKHRAQKVVEDVPAEIMERANESNMDQVMHAVATLKYFVQGWRSSGVTLEPNSAAAKLDHPNIAAVMGCLKGVCSDTGSYCAVFGMLKYVFDFDWHVDSVKLKGPMVFPSDPSSDDDRWSIEALDGFQDLTV